MSLVSRASFQLLRDLLPRRQTGLEGATAAEPRRERHSHLLALRQSAMAPARSALVGLLLLCFASAASARDLLEDAVSGEDIVPIMPSMAMLTGAVAARCAMPQRS